MLTEGATLLEVPTFRDARGSLSVIEDLRLPFQVKRVYNLFGVPMGAVRGEHAHRALEQIIMCMHGRVTINITDGVEASSISLNNPSKVLHLKPGIWRSLKFLEPDTVICVLASLEYDVADYIHDFEEYLRWASARRANR